MIINECGFLEWYESEFIKGKDGGERMVCKWKAT